MRLCFIDTETRARSGLRIPEHGDITKTGVSSYAHNSRVIMVQYAIDEGPVKVWATEDVDRDMRWVDAPADLLDFMADMYKGRGKMVAFNSRFDRYAMNCGMVATRAAETIPVRCIYDASVVARASNLPGDLNGAHAAIGGDGKLPDGRKLIQLFCTEDGGRPEDYPEEWATFCEYGQQDVEALRDLWNMLNPISDTIWEEFWAAEVVNDRGLPIDTDLVERLAAVAKLYRTHVNQRVEEITGGDLHSIFQHKKMAEWVYENLSELDPEIRAILTTKVSEDEDGEGVKVDLSLERARVERLILALERVDKEIGLTDEEAAVLDLLDVRCFGASNTPLKFNKASVRHYDDRLDGEYVFAGAQQTGRFSSRGLQVHNLARATIDDRDKGIAECEVLDAVMECDNERDAFDLIEETTGNVGKTLSRLIRPTISAHEGRTLVWGDWSAIEARLSPWITDSPEGQEVLDVIARSDVDPEAPDIYEVEAGRILGKDPKDITKQERQGYGKVTVLSLGFGGGVGALQAMATNYGVSFTKDEAKLLVDTWRGNNQWATEMWDLLWESFLEATANPGVVYPAGRVAFIHLDEYMRTTYMFLPDGRPIPYRDVKMRKVNVTLPDGTEEEQLKWTYRRAGAVRTLWHGELMNNAVQGTAGSRLREAIRVLSPAPDLDPQGREIDIFSPLEIVGHTHDEIIGEADLGNEEEAGLILYEEMNRIPDWLEGCPMVAEIETNWYYTKSNDPRPLKF